MKNKSLLALAIASVFAMAGCKSTTQESTESLLTIDSVKETVVNHGTQNITLEQAMAHPDWIGRQAEAAYWSLDSNNIVYKQKQLGNEIRDTFQVDLAGNSQIVPLKEHHALGAKAHAVSNNGKYQAYVFKGNIFVKSEQGLKQLTRSSERASQLKFLTNDLLSFRSNNTFYTIDVTTGLTNQLVALKLSDKPKGIKEPSSYIAKEQHKLIDYVALMHKNKKDKHAQTSALQEQNGSLADAPYYLGKGQRIVRAELSPNGKQLIVVTTKRQSWRGEGDIMPNYIGQNGEIVAEKVRRRVADAKSTGSSVVYIDLKTKQQSTLGFETLPGFDEDVLATVKKENYARDGKTYKSEKTPRDINLMMDWGWAQSPIQWSDNGERVAIMLEAWDNKDRWIATVDFDSNKLISQHRLHDDAWVNYTYNDFGWLNDNQSLYFLSEQSGYSHIYTKTSGENPVLQEQGRFVVSNLTRAKNSNSLFYKANKKHPGVYEIYQLNLDTGEHIALTDLDGMTDYQLSPNEQKLLLTHSKLGTPPELFVANVDGTAFKQLTNTVTKQFLSTQLVAPKVVAVPSSHTEQPIYAKVYYPSDYVEGETGKSRKAVIFNHGAGYLQNSHLGWSGYFREFMFHSMLAQKGYVVMDMDYRASKGYGRDWRTAIYRQMGTPEVQDLADGVKWLGENVNVDVNRVGTYGGSYGGFMTFMALFKEPELFQAGAALRPVSDWAHYNAPYTSNILNHPDVDPIAYERSSPIYFAEGLKKPLLINAPMIDDNVFFQDVVRLVQRFIELEKEDFETAIYPVEPHGFKQPSSWLDEYRRIFKLFEENL